MVHYFNRGYITNIDFKLYIVEEDLRQIFMGLPLDQKNDVSVKATNTLRKLLMSQGFESDTLFRIFCCVLYSF
jgi:hypothetical protein